jgi:hypothetical protein
MPAPTTVRESAGLAVGDACIVVIDNKKDDDLNGTWLGRVTAVRPDDASGRTEVEAEIDGPRLGAEMPSEDEPAIQLSLNGYAYRVLPASPALIEAYVTINRLTDLYAAAKKDATGATERATSTKQAYENHNERLLTENIALRTKKARDAVTDPRLVHILAKTAVETPDTCDVLLKAVMADPALSERLRLHVLRRRTQTHA